MSRLRLSPEASPADTAANAADTAATPDTDPADERQPMPLFSRPAMATGLPAMVVLVALTLSASGQASESLNPSVLRLAVVLIWPLAVYLLALTGRTWIAAAYCVAAGAVLRWNNFWPGGSSDVIKSVDEAFRTLFSGGNPYDHYYVSTHRRHGCRCRLVPPSSTSTSTRSSPRSSSATARSCAASP
jgi:hypothetical protein